MGYWVLSVFGNAPEWKNVDTGEEVDPFPNTAKKAMHQ